VSGYLHGLVARASGAPLADVSSARARRPPRFPIGAAGAEPTVTGPASAEAGPGRALDAPVVAMPRAERDDDRRPEVAVGELRVHRTARDRAETAAPMAAVQPTAAAPALTAATAAPPPASAPAHADGPAPHRVRARPHDLVPDEHDPGSAAQPPATVRLRPAPAPAPAPATPTTAPRIEVHIGRVEVRRPAVPAPRAWSRGDAGPSRPAPRGFGELAAARRYVDRLAR
jgi:hypothetical protein